MTQRRKCKCNSLGQTVEHLRYLAATPAWGELYTAKTVAPIARDAVYHINSLRRKLHQLNAKIQREARPDTLDGTD